MDVDEYLEDQYSPEAPDVFYLQAQDDIKALYESDRSKVYFVRQLQVKYEKEYFHWITHHAIKTQLQFGYIREERSLIRKGNHISFLVHHANRYPKRTIKEMARVIKEYSQDHITRSCGNLAEDLFCKAMSKKGFVIKAEKVRAFNGKKWDKTGHDLDFVFERDGVNYGCEIKNTLPYIDHDELEKKIDMYKHFNIKPLFILRYAPKTYIKQVNDDGGYVMLFETQVYDPSQIRLVEKIRESVGLPVLCSRAIPEGIMDRFEKWHHKSL